MGFWKALGTSVLVLIGMGVAILILSSWVNWTLSIENSTLGAFIFMAPIATAILVGLTWSLMNTETSAPSS